MTKTLYQLSCGVMMAAVALTAAGAGAVSQRSAPPHKVRIHIAPPAGSRLPEKPARVHGVPGAMNANGIGAVEFQGSGELFITFAGPSAEHTGDKGVLVYPRSARIEVDGEGEADPDHTTDAEVAFIHFSGRIHILMMGGKVRVAATAPITLAGNGIGKCALRGSGNWTINGASGTWPPKAQKITVGVP